jgi:hypothetical protein
MRQLRPNDVSVRAELVRARTTARGALAAREDAAAALRLLQSLPDEDTRTVEAGYLRLFPVHMAWTERNVPEAVRQLDEIDATAPYDESDWQRARRAHFRLSLGRLRQAEQIIRTLREPELRSINLAFLDLQRGDMRALSRRLRAYSGYDIVAASMLVRAGHLDAADQFVARKLPGVDPTSNPSLTEVQLAQSNAPDRRKALRDAIASLGRSTGRVFLYAETLAEAYDAAGLAGDAIEVLRMVGDGRDRVYGNSHNGHGWIRTQWQLAMLLRRTGRPADADAIESDLRALLAVADEDHPIVRALQQRHR